MYLMPSHPFDHETFRLSGLLSVGPSGIWVDDGAADVHALLRGRRGVTTIGSPTVNRRRSFRTKIRLAEGGFGTVHVREAHVAEDEAIFVDGGWATTVSRTLLDLARFKDDRFDRAWREALFRDLLDPPDLERVFGRPKRRGAPRAREKFNAEFFPERGDHGFDSPDELDFVQLIVRAGAPPPLVNHWIKTPSGWKRLDLYWELARLCVELDRWRTHKSRESFENDRVRDAELLQLGIATLRFTNTRVETQPQWCADQVLPQLAARTKR